MVDLHMHTMHSDGTWTTKKLLEEAEKAKIDYISITDHNSVEAYSDIKNIDVSSIYSGKIITGCEFSCYFNDARIELLGYNIDVEKTNKWIEENYNYEENNFQEEFNILITLCKKKNLRLTDNLIYDKNKGYPYDIVFEDIIKYPENKQYFTDEEWSSVNKFYRSASCNSDHFLHINLKESPEAKEVSGFIRSMGGKVFIAHSFVYNFNNILDVLDSLISNKIIDGIEVYHTDHTEEESKILLEICKEKKLLISAGSDCHGDKKKERKIGRIFKGQPIENSIVSELLKSINLNM